MDAIFAEQNEVLLDIPALLFIYAPRAVDWSSSMFYFSLLKAKVFHELKRKRWSWADLRKQSIKPINGVWIFYCLASLTILPDSSIIYLIQCWWCVREHNFFETPTKHRSSFILYFNSIKTFAEMKLIELWADYYWIILNQFIFCFSFYCNYYLMI